MPDLDARFMIEERTCYTLSDIIAAPDSMLSQEQYDTIQADAHKRIGGMPLSRIYGMREFWGLPFEITPDTLDPRPDTELIIELALKRFKDSPPKTILDIGTGSGCILIALLSEFPDAIGLGVDISFGAISTARCNAKRNNIGSRAGFICGSWIESIAAGFDLIVSNPPYIADSVIPTLSPEVQNHDPILALDGGEDGLNPYKILFPKIKNILNPSGTALFEIGFDQEENVMRLAEDSGFALRTVHIDYAGNPRVVDISRGDK